MNYLFNKFFKAGLTALLFAVSMEPIWAQNIIDQTINTGLTGEGPMADMAVYHDSIVVVGSVEQNNNHYVFNVQVFSSVDLRLIKTIEVNSSSNRYGFTSMQDIGNGYLTMAESFTDSAILHFYKFNPNTLSVSELFRKTIASHGYYYTSASIIDNEVYAMYLHTLGTIDTTQIDVYDLTGNRLRHLKHWLPPTSLAQDSVLNPNYFLGPYKHPTKPDKIVYGNGFECRVAILDKNTLELEYVMPREPLQLYYSVTYIYGYQLYDDKIVAGGTCRYSPDPPNINWEFQSYYQARSWNGDSLERRGLGDLSVAERSYAFNAEPSTGTTYLGAAAPFFNYIKEGAEYRQIKIHRFNQFGHDTIMIYGDKNHVPFSIKHTSNGDLFVLSTYTDAWTTDSTYLVLTKIPGFAISLIDEGKVSPRVQFYPNPTQDYLKVDGLMGDPEKVKVYDQQGRLHLTAEVEGKEISMLGLKPGLYIVVVTGKDGDSYSAIVKKE